MFPWSIWCFRKHLEILILISIILQCWGGKILLNLDRGWMRSQTTMMMMCWNLSRMTSSSSTGLGLSCRLSSSVPSLWTMESTRERGVCLPQAGHSHLQSAGAEGDLRGGQGPPHPGQRILEKWVPASVSSRHLRFRDILLLVRINWKCGAWWWCWVFIVNINIVLAVSPVVSRYNLL